jgi:hypothetical protein
MSRSRKKTPIFGNASGSEKLYKAFEHRRERRLVRMLLLIGKEDMPQPKKFGNPWGGPKDGKSWWAKDEWRKVWDEESGRHIHSQRTIELFAKYMRK